MLQVPMRRLRQILTKTTKNTWATARAPHTKRTCPRHKHKHACARIIIKRADASWPVHFHHDESAARGRAHKHNARRPTPDCPEIGTQTLSSVFFGFFFFSKDDNDRHRTIAWRSYDARSWLRDCTNEVADCTADRKRALGTSFPEAKARGQDRLYLDENCPSAVEPWEIRRG